MLICGDSDDYIVCGVLENLSFLNSCGGINGQTVITFSGRFSRAQNENLSDTKWSASQNSVNTLMEIDDMFKQNTKIQYKEQQHCQFRRLGLK